MNTLRGALSYRLVLVLGFLFISPGSNWQLLAEEQKSTPVDHETKKPKRSFENGLGTTSYAPSENEKPFFEKLGPDEVATGGLAGEYDISSKDGTYVGWFGIVREIHDDPENKQSELLVEHKYFDGLTDLHIQALSFNGSGDFKVVVQGLDHEIKPLTLVKVYGKAKVMKETISIDAEFIRNWHWGTFTFLAAFGTQQGSEKWRKLNKVPLDDIYDPFPDDDYYEQRLGPKPKD